MKKTSKQVKIRTEVVESAEKVKAETGLPVATQFEKGWKELYGDKLTNAETEKKP